MKEIDFRSWNSRRFFKKKIIFITLRLKKEGMNFIGRV